MRSKDKQKNVSQVIKFIQKSISFSFHWPQDEDAIHHLHHNNDYIKSMQMYSF